VIYLFTTASRTALGPTQTPIQWVPGALSLRAKRPVREAIHSPPLMPSLKNAWSYNSIPQYAFMVWCSVKAQRQLYLYFKHEYMSRDISVGIALGYGLNDQSSRVRFPEVGIFIFTTASRTALGPSQPPIQWVPGTPSME
jgi:hypothetical protein